MPDLKNDSHNSALNIPVAEHENLTYQLPLVQRHSIKVDNIDDKYNLNLSRSQNPEKDVSKQEILAIPPRYNDEIIFLEDEDGLNTRLGNKSRRGTFTNHDIRSSSPPNSVKAFADARRRERKLSCSDPSTSKLVVESRRHEIYDIDRAASSAFSRDSRRSHRSRVSRKITREQEDDENVDDDDDDNDNDDTSSSPGSNKPTEDDVFYPSVTTGNKDTLQIDFQILNSLIANLQSRNEGPLGGNPHPRIFNDLRHPHQYEEPTQFTLSGEIVDVPSKSSRISEKTSSHGSLKNSLTDPERSAENRFEFFSSLGESTIHAPEFGDLVLPGEDFSSLFAPSKQHDVDGVWWLNMNNPCGEEIRTICKAFGVHPLTIEDIVTQETHEKIELFPSYYFACFRSFHVEQINGGQEYVPFNIYVIVFREGTLSLSFYPNPHATHVRKRITLLKDYVALSSDWICYALIDNIVDSFAPVISKIESETDNIEDEVFIARNDDMHTFLRRIGMVRKNVMGLMKLLGGKADVLRGFTKRCNADYKVTPRMDIGLYLGDIQDHVVTMMASLAHFEKMLSRCHSNYLAQLSIDNITQGNQANKVLSKITLLASILVPLNLVCGMFGMNVKVPWRDTESLIPFFGILGLLSLFTLISLLIARRFGFI